MAALLLASACNARSLAPGSDGGSVLTPTKSGGDASAAGAARGSGAPGGSVGAGRQDGAQGGVGAGAAGPGVGTSTPVCRPIDAVGPAPLLRSFSLPAATRFPFSCRPLPSAFMFPPPGADVPGRYTRCASFDVGAARSVALSPDGGLAALVTDDGLVRIVSVAGQQVLAALASPRAMIDLVAYQPHGRAVMTLARAQREVTLWRTSDWKPVWRVTLGMPYYHASGGGLAFSPDGASAVVSTGADTFVFDVATGATLAQRPSPADMVSDVAYAWGGRRIVVAEPLAAAHRCHGQAGGKVTVLDAATLAPVATVADLGSDADPGGARGVPQFLASPTDDLVLLPVVPPVVGEPQALLAYRVSDGGALPAPPLVGGLPAAFLPDGATVLMRDANGMRRVRLADGLQGPTVAVAGGPMAVSADGDLIALGGSGADLLRVANADGAPPTTICAADDPTGNASGPTEASSPNPSGLGATSALSFDGQLLALAAHGEVRIIQRADGAVMTRFSDGIPADLEPVRVVFSPLGKFVVTQPQATASVNSVFPVLAVGRVGAFLPDVNGWSWTGVAFSQQEDRVYSNGYRVGAPRLDAMDLPWGATSTTSLGNFTVVIGTSNGCPVLYESTRGAWRSCGACQDAPIGGGEQYNPFGARGGVLSSDGQYVGTWSNVHDPGVKVWRLPPAAARVASLAGRSGWNGWWPVEYAVAIAPGAARVLTAAQPAGDCYEGPEFPIWVHDPGAGGVVDVLPPAPAAADAALRTIAYGAQLWCAR